VKPEAGYTLLELLVVLAIMALLIAAVPGMALPVVNAVRFSGQVAAVTSRLATAHEAAIETGQVVTITTADFSTSASVTILSPDSPAITFYPDGSATGGPLRITFAGREKTLTINTVTGSVR